MAKKKTATVNSEAPKETVSQDTELLNKVKKDFNTSWDYTKAAWHQRWQNNYKLYNNERVKVGYVGISKTFVPMTFSTVETMTSALFGAKPKFNFLPPRKKSDQKTDILNALLDYFWEKDQWSIKVINTGRGMLMRGVGVDYFYWNGDHPCMINVPLRDFFIDPTATSLENARYMGRRYLISKEELEEFEIVDLEAEPDKDGNYPMKKKYTNLDKLETPDETTSADATEGAGQTPSDQSTDKEEKDLFYGSTLGKDSDQVEVIEWWGCVKDGDKWEDKVVSIANRRIIIENSENYYKAKAKANAKSKQTAEEKGEPDYSALYAEPVMPFAAARDYVDESLFYAKSEVDFIADQQEDLNDISNQNKDSITFSLNQMYEVNINKTTVQPNEVENLPGAAYPVTESGAITPIPHNTIPPDAFMERQNIKSEIRETTASNEIVKGAPSQKGSDPTATEINAQIAGAGQRINLKVTQIENEYFHRIARIVFAMVRLYVTEPTMVRIVGKDGARWEQFDPEEFSDGDYEPRVQLDISIENQKSQDAQQAQAMLAAFLNDQDVNQIELKKYALAKGFRLDPDEVEALMTPAPAPPIPPTPPMMPPMGSGMPPQMASLPPQAGAMPPMPQEDMALMQSQGQGNYTDPVTGETIPAAAMQALGGA